ncbi:hypothetical protein K457DRAFT_758081 [Linnemannia elongata AG-77]|uniref:Uncharacterized protein n=1 Tax=Linnemannia elongata AG-77 TaxID=1314771 RepID=A0A197JLW6_9FUNG|nr:hypothetical protein K457DRAFT_758081 [Linnemannia elongata AG-77]
MLHHTTRTTKKYHQARRHFVFRKKKNTKELVLPDHFLTSYNWEHTWKNCSLHLNDTLRILVMTRRNHIRERVLATESQGKSHSGVGTRHNILQEYSIQKSRLDA